MATMRGALQELRYPFQFDSFAATLLWSTVFYVLFFFTALGYLAAAGQPVYWFAALIWLAAILGWLEYCAAILDGAAEGRRAPPVMTSELLLSSGRMLSPLLLSAILLGGAWQAESSRFIGLQGLLVALWLLLLPAWLMLAARSAGLVAQFDPLVLSRLLRALGWLYPVAMIAVMALGWTALQIFSNVGDWVFLRFAVVCVLTLMTFRLLGNIAFWRRDALGLAVAWSPETQELAEDAAVIKARDNILYKAYQLSEGNVLNEAEALLLPSWPEHGRELFARIRTWPNRKLALRLADREAQRLLDDGHPIQALAVYQWCLEQNPGYAPSALYTLDRVLAACLEPKSRAVGKVLVDNLATIAPNHPFLPQLRRRIANDPTG